MDLTVFNCYADGATEIAAEKADLWPGGASLSPIETMYYVNDAIKRIGLERIRPGPAQALFPHLNRAQLKEAVSCRAS